MNKHYVAATALNTAEKFLYIERDGEDPEVARMYYNILKQQIKKT